MVYNYKLNVVFKTANRRKKNWGEIFYQHLALSLLLLVKRSEHMSLVEDIR